MIMTAPGPPFAIISPHPRNAFDASRRHDGHVRSLCRRSSMGVATSTTQAWQSSTMDMASGAPMKPRELVSAKTRKIWMTALQMVMHIGVRTHRCAWRKAVRSVHTIKPGSPMSRK